MSEVTYFMNLWERQGQTLTSQQKDEIGKAFLEHIVGLDGAQISSFLESVASAEKSLIHQRVGRQFAQIELGGKYPLFWEEVAKITHSAYSAEDLAWLKENGGSEGAVLLLNSVGPVGKNKGLNPLLYEIERCAMAHH